MASRQQWFETLRLQLQQEHGKGWIVREVGATSRRPIGRCQLICIWEDRTRSHVTLPLDWKASNSTAIATTVGQLRPAELAVLKVREGKGYVGHVKRNSSSMGAKAKPPRW